MGREVELWLTENIFRPKIKLAYSNNLLMKARMSLVVLTCVDGTQLNMTNSNLYTKENFLIVPE